MTIKKQVAQIKADIRALHVRLAACQKRCKHPNASRTACSNTGNYDPSQDSYWYDFHCPDCDRHWTMTDDR